MADFHIDIPEDAKRIISTIEANGCQAYVVGGCVRDSILGRNPDDWDITTSAIPSQTKSFFARTVDTGIKHGTVTVMVGKEGYEVTTYRIDGEYKDGRHPESVEFAARLVDDLMRRDFTINAMAYNDDQGLVDEFDGLGDLERKLIKCVGNPMERFTEDALRMMRAIRFSAQLGFDIDKDTYAAIVKLAPTIKQVSMERIQVELLKTIMSDHPEHVQLYHKTGILKQVLPHIDSIMAGKYAKNAITMLKYSEKTPVLRYAALLNTLEAGQVTETLKALKLDNYTIDTVTKIVANSKTTIEEHEPAVREALSKFGKDLLSLMFLHEKCVISTKEEITGLSMMGRKKHLVALEYMYKDIIRRGDCFTVKDLDISGNDLMEYGLKGKEIGETLEKLLRMVIENPKLNEKSILIALVENLK